MGFVLFWIPGLDSWGGRLDTARCALFFSGYVKTAHMGRKCAHGRGFCRAGGEMWQIWPKPMC